MTCVSRAAALLTYLDNPLMPLVSDLPAMTAFAAIPAVFRIPCFSAASAFTAVPFVSFDTAGSKNPPSFQILRQRFYAYRKNVYQAHKQQPAQHKNKQCGPQFAKPSGHTVAI